MDLLQTLGSWLTGDFSGVLRGRYELLWIAAVMTALAWLAADRFTVAGMGEEFSTNLGLHYGRVLALGLAVVAVVSAVVVVTAGAIPFLGLIVPNVVSILVGDNLRRSIPWVAVLGAGFVLVCDMVGRVVRDAVRDAGRGHRRRGRRPSCSSICCCGSPPVRTDTRLTPAVRIALLTILALGCVAAFATVGIQGSWSFAVPFRAPQGRRDGGGRRRDRSLHRAVPDGHRQPHPDALRSWASTRSTC